MTFTLPVMLATYVLFGTLTVGSQKPANPSGQPPRPSISRSPESTVKKSEPQVNLFETNLLQGYRESIRQQKPLIALFFCPLTRKKCVHCKRMRGSIFAPSLQEFSDRAIFVMVVVKDGKSEDAGGEKIYKRLGIKKTPTISVIAPDAKAIREMGRINGYHPPHRLFGHLNRMLEKTEAWVRKPSSASETNQPEKR